MHQLITVTSGLFNIMEDRIILTWFLLRSKFMIAWLQRCQVPSGWAAAMDSEMIYEIIGNMYN